MNPSRRTIALLCLAAPLAAGSPAWAMARQPLVLAPGAGTAETPAGSRGAFEQAIREGADFIVADFTPTKDGALAALSDNELSGATNVAARTEFAARRGSRIIHGQERFGWFAEDFTLGELKTLTLTAPAGRRRGADSGFRAILTFEEIVAIARAGSVRTARVIGVHAGIAHTAYFAGLDLAVEPRLADAIRAAGYDSPAAAMFVASAEPDSLKVIGELTRARRVLKLGDAPTPPSERIRAFAEAVAPGVGEVLDLGAPRGLPATVEIADAHAAGLAVHAWTLGASFPPSPLRPGDGRRLLGALFMAGADAVAGEPASLVARARDDALARRG